MIEFLNIHNFKTLLNASFPLAELNLFTGLNGMGKSSLIQSLLLLRQSYERQVLLGKGLLLNGEYVSLGTGADALAKDAQTDEIAFTFKWQGHEHPCFFQFSYEMNSDLLPCKDLSVPYELSQFSLFNTHFQYLSAERLGPRSHHALSDFYVKNLKSLGQHGEYTVHFVAAYWDQPLALLGLKHPQAGSDNLLDNLEAWMSEITPGLKIRAQAMPQFNSASLSFAFVQGKEITDYFKPQNVGFGLSYVLPVVTAILSAAKGNLLLIENPESHLHPAGQAVMGKLCALAAKQGVQLMIESHSDHFLNGVRVAVKQQLVGCDQVKVYYLQRNQEDAGHISEVFSPNIDEQGRMDCWPDGFFDEWDKQLDFLL